ncbi:MAG: ATP phosphoribosyltransferase [Candidatus Brocadiae bacterium]|nr:ATP phosphoribosyltransferase [Candidatus Brocadiia bacterium]
MPPLRIAVPNKGRLSDPALGMMRDIGLPVVGLGRTLVAHLAGGAIEVLFARAEDIPEFVELGAADIGITGSDLVREAGAEVETLLPLGFGICRLVVAVPEHSLMKTVEDIPDAAVVATAFPRITGEYFREKGKVLTVVPVSGATEITPYIGVSDLITDLAETGSTLKKNHLTQIGTICEVSAVLVGNRAKCCEKEHEVHEVVAAMASVLQAKEKRYLMANVPKSSLDEVRRLVPGVSGPTVMNLAGTDGMVAIHAVVPEKSINGLVPPLKKLGATGILVLPIERMVV